MIRSAMYFPCAGLLLATVAASAAAKETLVHNVAEFDAAVKAAEPGDEIVLADGEWRDAELVFRGEGEAKERITLRAQTPGRVILLDKSRLRIGGKYLEVAGLFWKNSAAEREIIAFRINSNTHAEHCTLTECTVQGDVPKQERKWVSLYGRNNGVHNCRFEQKQSDGTLLVVWLDDDAETPLHHMITDNFFGPRSKLGKNGGEIIRVGDSKTSHLWPRVHVANNYFYRCDGEAEIISNKSCGNNYNYNSFVGCSGALTFRHGHAGTAMCNNFFGDGRDGTGGVRVIGRGHHVESNLFYELTGDDTRAAVSLMNGIPDSPANGYDQVEQATVMKNTFIGCKQSIVVGLRDDDQPHQSLAPTECMFFENAILTRGRAVFTVDNPMEVGVHRNNWYFGGELGLTEASGWHSASAWPNADLRQRRTVRVGDDGVEAQEFYFVEPDDVGPAWIPPGDEFLPKALQKN